MPSAERRPVRPVLAVRAGYRVLCERWDVLLVIAAGGVVGSLGRWAAGVAFPHRAGGFPGATLAVNVIGCLAIGVLMTAVAVLPPSRYLRPFLGTGILGGFTTFSTYMLDTRALVVAGRPGAAGAYLAGTLAAGLAAVRVGAWLARALLTPALLRSAPGPVAGGSVAGGPVAGGSVPGSAAGGSAAGGSVTGGPVAPGSAARGPVAAPPPAPPGAEAGEPEESLS